MDILIAAHAKSLGNTMVTDNIRHFSRIEGLQLEDWIERQPHILPVLRYVLVLRKRAEA